MSLNHIQSTMGRQLRNLVREKTDLKIIIIIRFFS